MKSPVVCQIVPSNEYSIAPTPPVAVIVTAPSFIPQSVGSVKLTLVIVGVFGASIVIGLSVDNTVQVPAVLRTATLYTPEPKLLNVLDDCQLRPPSIEYSNVAPVASTVIVPSLVPQPVASAAVTLLIIGNTGATRVTVGLVISQVPSIFLTLTS